MSDIISVAIEPKVEAAKDSIDGTDASIRYYYFGRRIFPRHQGVVTAGAVSLPHGAQEPARFKVAFAYCAPSDIFRRRTSGIERRRQIKYDNGETTCTSVDVVIHGGVDIVNSRLGVCPIKEYPEQAYVIYRNGDTLMTQIMYAFNHVVPVDDKPQLWAKRQLVLAPRIVQIASFCRHKRLDMQLGWNILQACEERIPGFVYVD